MKATGERQWGLEALRRMEVCIIELERAPNELWFSAGNNWDEPIIFYRHKGGIRARGSDDAPEAVVEYAPEGWSVWEGTVRRLTAEELTGGAQEATGTYYPSDMRPGDEWWEGELRPATAGEVLAFFGLSP